jgi:uncharacterized membrane protein
MTDSQSSKSSQRVRNGDREAGSWSTIVSALNLVELDEMMARFAAYSTLAEVVRERLPKTLREAE